MKRILPFLNLIFFLISCEARKDESMSFNGKEILKHTSEYGLLPPVNAWNKICGEAIPDSLNRYKKNESIRLFPSENSDKKVQIEFPFDFSDIEGHDLVIKGNYKLTSLSNAKISFHIIQSKGAESKADSLVIDSSINPTWEEFHLKTSLDTILTNALFIIKGEGDVDLLINNCQTLIDQQPLSDLINKKYKAEEDCEFDQQSGIKLGELTPQMTDNLEILCRVWGFMKYYHSEVTQGNYNWDYELFRILPEIANATDKNERNFILNKWIDKYGAIKETPEYVITDSANYSRFINLDWINDTEIFNDTIIYKLNKIKNAKRSKKFNYYSLTHIHSRSEVPFQPFKRERKYEHIKWNDQGFRILTLFRLWNMIEYCFPYTEYTDASWDTLIKEFIPAFVYPENELNYLLAIQKLTAKMDDSHVSVYFPSNKLSEEPFYPKRRKYKVPVELIQSAEGYIVVKFTRSTSFERGDIIYSINGKKEDEIIDEMSQYISASNRGGLVRRALRYLLSTDSGMLEVEIIRNGKKIKSVINDFSSNREEAGINSWETYNLDRKDIIHCYGDKNEDETRAMVLENMNSKGFIIDARINQINNFRSISNLLSVEDHLWISENDKSYPGNYYLMAGRNKVPASIDNPQYKGKIVILVDEYTQSAQESWAIMFRTAPNSIIVGRQTAGADGNICVAGLPGDISLGYTQLGLYYPHWGKVQRKGVRIDVPVSPTVDDIKNGRDIWIEKAIEVIGNE